ncbi:MAG: ribosomal protein S18-alanine N-acetyltransferase [Ardenticatenaceae bacterium]|nr:ribosomal protein S18-alanine N-acetyltransferase [Ardenticatenaceae bacterium]
MAIAFPNTIQLRQMTSADIPQLLQIEAEIRRSPWQSETFQKEIDNPLCRAVVITVIEAVVGYGLSWLVGDECQIHYLAVGKHKRGQGFGELLLFDALDYARHQGAQWATLEVRDSNLPARTLYEKYRFKIVGRRDSYYQDTGEDALLMNAFLGDPDYHQFMEEAAHDLQFKLSNEGKSP